MNDFAKKYPFYMTPETARELLQQSRRRRMLRNLKATTSFVRPTLRLIKR